MLFLMLDCGRRVSLDAFRYSRTYGDLLMGRPNARLNAQIIDRAVAKPDPAWGPRKTHLIPPPVDTRDPEYPELPPVLLRAWLTCADPVDPAFMGMGSELVVVWFTDECHTEPIEEVVYRAVLGLPWEQLATDVDW